MVSKLRQIQKIHMSDKQEMCPVSQDKITWPTKWGQLISYAKELPVSHKPREDPILPCPFYIVPTFLTVWSQL